MVAVGVGDENRFLPGDDDRRYLKLLLGGGSGGDRRFLRGALRRGPDGHGPADRGAACGKLWPHKIPRPPKTNLGLRPWHDPIGAFVEGSVVLGSRRVKGREDVAVLRHYVSQTDPHDVFAHFNVVHNLRALWANHLARRNLLQLAAGHHAMQHYARRVLSQNMFGMMR